MTEELLRLSEVLRAWLARYLQESAAQQQAEERMLAG
jgi:hypothetical protein